MGQRDTYRDTLIEIARRTICRPCLAIGLSMARSSLLSKRIDYINRSTGNHRPLSDWKTRSFSLLSITIFAVLSASVYFVPRTSAAQTAQSDQLTSNQSAMDPQADTQGLPVSQSVSSTFDYEKQQATLDNDGIPIDSLIGVLGTGRLKHSMFVRAAAWSPDGSKLGTVGSDSYLKIWDPDSGKLLVQFHNPSTWTGGVEMCNGLAFDSKGENVAVATGTNAVRIWNLPSGKETHLVKTEEVWSVCWHPHEPWIATGGQSDATIWDVQAGEIRPILIIPARDPDFKRQFVNDAVLVRFTPDGKELVVAHPDGSVRFCDPTSGRVNHEVVRTGHAVRAFDLDHEHDRIVTGFSDGMVTVWKVSTGDRLFEVGSDPHSIEGVCFSRQCDSIYCGGLSGFIHKWDLTDGKRVSDIRVSNYMWTGQLAMHPTRDLLVSTGLVARIWDTTTEKTHVPQEGHLGSITTLAFTPDGSKLISSAYDSTIRVWDVAKQTELQQYIVGETPVRSIDMMPDGKSIVEINESQGTINLRRIDDGTITHSIKKENEGQSVKVSPDGQWIAMTNAVRKDRDYGIMIWNLKTNEHHKIPTTFEGEVHFNADSTKLALVGTSPSYGQDSRSRLTVWNLSDRTKLEQTLIQELDNVRASAISADGTTLALFGSSYSADDQAHQQIVLWDWTSSSVRTVIDTKGHYSKELKFSADGRSLVSVSNRSGEICIFDPRDGSLRQTIKVSHGGGWWVGSAAMTPGGDQIAIGLGTGAIDLVRVQPTPADVPVKTFVPKIVEEPESDPWKSLLGKSAPEWQPDAWLAGDPITLKELKGKWVVVYFWNDSSSEQDMPSWMGLYNAFSKEHLEIVVLLPALWGDWTAEDQRRSLVKQLQTVLDGRSLPFRVMLDKKQPNEIDVTGTKTGGATYAQYRVMNTRRGYRTDSLALLIDPTGTIVQNFPARAGSRTIKDFENFMGSGARAKTAESEFPKEYTLRDDEVLRRWAPPFSKARDDYSFYRYGRSAVTMTFQQTERLRESWSSYALSPRLDFVTEHVIKMGNFEFDDPAKVLERTISGDWTYRLDVSPVDRLKALQRVLQEDLGWKVRFERRQMQQDIVVMKGEWKQSPLPGLENESAIYFTIDETPNPNFGGGGSGKFGEMIDSLANRCGIRFINEVRQIPNVTMEWRDRLSNDLAEIRNRSEEGQRNRDRLLQLLHKQTGLTFDIEKRMVDVWKIVNEQPEAIR